MQTDTPPPLVTPELAALMRRRVSIIVGSRDAGHRPHLMRAVGCRLAPDRRELTLFMVGTSSLAVLDDLRANRLIAVVFSEPSTDRTLQLKGDDARIEASAPGDHALVQHYIDCFADEISMLGFDRELVKTLFQYEPQDLVAVRFTPREAYEQTPGPNAGAALGGKAA
jgi:hypothetical protein